MPALVTLDGRSLSIADVVTVARGGAPVAIAAPSLALVTASRRVIEAAVARGDTVYGVNTGFGKLAHVRIKPEQTRELQRNLIRSHASGVGDPLAVDAVRAMMLLRANVLLRGTSGVRPELPGLIVEMLNAGVHPRVPSQGSVGASGDLAPLAHLALTTRVPIRSSSAPPRCCVTCSPTPRSGSRIARTTRACRTPIRCAARPRSSGRWAKAWRSRSDWS